MFGFSKIKVGKSGYKKSKFALQHDVNTTANFGFCQPLMVRELTADSDASLQVESLVRLAPMPCPTFGRVNYNIYNRFVPMTSIYEPFNELLSGMPYNTSNGSYIPTKVPNCTIAQLSKYILSMCGRQVCAWTSPYAFDGSSTDNYYKIGGLQLASNNTPFTWADNDDWQDFLDSNFLLHDMPYYNFDSVLLDNISEDSNQYCTPFNADYVIYQDSEIPSTQDTYKIFFCFKFNNEFKNLLKVLKGCGFALDIYDDTPVSLLPLFAYYKAWFDTFEVQRYITWTSTNAYKLIDSFRENDLVNWNQFVGSAVFNDFLGDLCYCYFTDEPDFISSHISSLNESFSGDSVSLPNSSYNYVNNSDSVYSGHDSIPEISYTEPITDVKLQILKVLTKFVNKNTVIGGRINDYLRAHGLGDNLVGYDSNYIGSSSVNCQISDVMSQSQTLTDNAGTIEGANLGEYAGKGIGYGEGNYVKFHTNVPGFWVCLAAIVPQSKYSQGVDPMLSHITKFEYYRPEFDAKGMQVTRQSALLTSGNVSMSSNSWAGNGAFGYIPRYTEYKVTRNVLNGDFSLRSLQDSLLPYVLDKRIQESTVTYGSVNNGVYSDVEFTIPTAKAPGAIWRYIGRYKFLGNYNRMFYNTDDGFEDSASWMSDNFIVHNVLNFNVIAPMKPVSESFDTDGEDGYTTEVQHS